jgi:hypothetical protein
LRCDLLRAPGPSGRRDGASPSEDSARRRVPLPDTTRPRRRCGRRSSSSRGGAGSPDPPTSARIAGASTGATSRAAPEGTVVDPVTRGSPTSAGKGAGSGGSSKLGKSRSASIPPTTTAVHRATAPHWTRSPMGSYRPQPMKLSPRNRSGMRSWVFLIWSVAKRAPQSDSSRESGTKFVSGATAKRTSTPDWEDPTPLTQPLRATRLYL